MRTKLICGCGKRGITLGLACRMATCKWEEMRNKHQIFCCGIVESGVLSSNGVYSFLVAISLSLYIYHTLIRVWCKWDRHVGGGPAILFGVPDFAKMWKIRIHEMKTKKSPKLWKKIEFFWPHLDSDFRLVAFFKIVCFYYGSSFTILAIHSRIIN